MPDNQNALRKKTEIPVIWGRAGKGIPYCTAIVDGVQKMASRRGYQVALYDDSTELLAQQPAGRAVIVVGFESSQLPRTLNELLSAHMRVVVTNMDSDHIDSHYSCATFSRRIATEQMLDYLFKKGCSRVALIGCGEHSVNDMVHHDAMLKYLPRFLGAYGKSYWYKTRITESFEAFYQERAQFDAVLCPNDYAAVSFLHYCEKRGLSVPHDFMLASFKGHGICRCCRPTITSLEVDFSAIGENSVSVWKFLEDAKGDNLQMRVTVPGHIVERESTLGGAEAPRPAPLTQDESYQGGPFYHEPSLTALVLIEHCLQNADALDRRIIEALLGGMSYEKIAESLFLSESAFKYRVRKLFQALEVDTRHEFQALFEDNFTAGHQFDADDSAPEIIFAP